MSRFVTAASAFVLGCIAATTLSAQPGSRNSVQPGGIMIADQDLETFELRPGQRVRISPDGSRVESEIGVITGGNPVASGKTVIQTTRMGTSTNIATGKGAIACSQVGDRKTCVVNQGGTSRVVEDTASAPQPAIDHCFEARSVAQAIACAEAAVNEAVR